MDSMPEFLATGRAFLHEVLNMNMLALRIRSNCRHNLEQFSCLKVIVKDSESIGKVSKSSLHDPLNSMDLPIF